MNKIIFEKNVQNFCKKIGGCKLGTVNTSVRIFYDFFSRFRTERQTANAHKEQVESLKARLKDVSCING